MDISFPISVSFASAVRGARQRRAGPRRRGSLHGEWWQHIPAHGRQPAKLDLVSCRHTGDELTATIRRVEPEEQDHKRWTFLGHVRNSMVFGAFFSDDPNDLSYGTIFLRVGVEATRLDGHYTRLHVVDSGKLRQEEIADVAHCWSRLRTLAWPVSPASVDV